jgi:peptide chain release factor-like protein
MMHPAQLDKDSLRKDCVLQRGRSSGPGGQHRNKVSTMVTLTHTPTSVHAQAGERRSPAANESVALRRLRLLLAVQVRTAPPKTKGLEELASELWRTRRGKDRTISINANHWDYPSLLAEALNVLSDSLWDSHRAGIRMGVSQSQLLKLIKKHPPALAYWNEQRVKHGKRPLH